MRTAVIMTWLALCAAFATGCGEDPAEATLSARSAQRSS